MAKLHETEIHFVNGIFMCFHAGHMDEDDFWEVIKEADFKKEDVENMILPHTDMTVREHIDR